MSTEVQKIAIFACIAVAGFVGLAHGVKYSGWAVFVGLLGAACT